MADPRQEAVLAHFRRSQQAVERAAADGKFVAATVAIAERITAALKSGGKLLLAGNGGSASDAQHIAAEFVGRFVNDRAPLAAVIETLTDVPCRPCHKPTCRLIHHRCMRDIPAAQVLPTVYRALGRIADRA